MPWWNKLFGRRDSSRRGTAIVRDSDLGERLCQAVDACNLEEVRRLVEQGANVNHRTTNDRTPLHFAVQRCQDDERAVEIARLLLQHRANPNAQMQGAFTPLHGLNYTEADYLLGQVLVSHGADRRMRSDFGSTPAELFRDRLSVFPRMGEKIPDHATKLLRLLSS